ncbi:MAG: prephenate dehydratase [Phycisphaeraceae bacterium]|nr:MAG: prephenate dehydratase [Phycisphaeraceae bacterium]
MPGPQRRPSKERASTKKTRGRGPNGGGSGKEAQTNPGTTRAEGKGPTSAGEKRAAEVLPKLRSKIDSLDKKLVKMLNDRASLVVEVGRLKRAAKMPIYAPHREAEVLDKVTRQNAGPLPNRALEGVYRELMSGSFQLQQPLRIGFLGPPGSFSHVAAARHFGSSVAFEDLHEIEGVFTEVTRGHVNYGLVPIENSIGGGIVESLDSFQRHFGEVNIYAEVQLEVHHCLLAQCEPGQVRRIHSKPEVFSQCRHWLATQYPQAEQIASASSSRAAMTAAEECKLARQIGSEPGSAAIGSELAGELYGLRVLFAKIEDNPSNVTRFFVISRQKAQRSGDDKTSIMFNTLDKPGALVSVLRVFEEHGINLTHIDKRPSGKSNWSYVFFIDAAGHRDDPGMAHAIEEASTHCMEMHVLGSYPKSKRIL